MFAYRQHQELCRRHPVARSRISRPGIPSSFSESLAAAVLPSLLGKETVIDFGGRAADLVAVLSDMREVAIEVKASGASSFQEIKPRDLAADALVWIDFGSRYVDGAGAITLHWLPEPSRCELPRRKLTLGVFLAGASQHHGFASRTFTTLDDALDAGVGVWRAGPMRLPLDDA